MTTLLVQPQRALVSVSVAFCAPSLAVSQHGGLCCVIVLFFACQGGAGVSVRGVFVTVCVGVCMCARAAQSSPVIAGSPDTDGAQ